MTPELDFLLDGMSPADEASAALQERTWEFDFDPIVRHQVGDRSYFLAFDTSATWNVVRNLPNLAAFDIRRDQAKGTFTMDGSMHANLAFGQKWLVNRGCPPEAAKVRGLSYEPSDELTVRVEDQIRCSGDRYEVVAVMAADEDPTEAWTMAMDSKASELPVRVFLEQSQPDQLTYSVREGAFPDCPAAQMWLDARSTPLPEPPEYRRNAEALRTRAALTRSSAPASPSVAPVAAAVTPTVAAAAQPGLGRSL